MSRMITGLWLDSGKKLVGPIALVGENFLVRTGERTIVCVPGHKVSSVETEYDTKEEVEAVFSRSTALADTRNIHSGHP